jgi:pimeloyl-ACP methyl ester carboxylesterase
MVDPERVPPGKLAEYEANFSTLEAARAAISYYRQGLRRNLSPRGLREMRAYPRIRAPFLLIWGEQDTALRKTLTKGLGRHFELRPVVHYLPEEGHFVPLEAPEKVAALLIEHLSDERREESWGLLEAYEEEGPQPQA